MTTNYDLDTKEGMANSVAWTQQIFDTLTSKGQWVVPRSGTVIRVDKANKTAYITQGFVSDTGMERVIKAMGWTVEYR
jgi:hypothetical protein